MLLPESRRLNFSEVEMIDLGGSTTRDLSGEVVAAIEKACSQTGFFYLSNHGIEAPIITELRAQSAAFFALPMAERMKIRMGASIRGYLPLNYRSEETDSPAGTNLQEGFWMAHERAPDNDCPFDGPNVWPARCPKLKPSMEAYFNAIEALSKRLQRAFAEALKVDKKRFERLFEHAQSRLKLNHYPSQSRPESLDEIGVVPHTDTGAFTILWQDENGGLEIENKHGEWVSVPPIENTFVVNIGNALQMLSAGYFSSTPHRVINRSGGDRYSIAFFTNPGHHALMEPLLATPGKRYEPLTFGAYQRKEYRGIYPIAFT